MTETDKPGTTRTEWSVIGPKGGGWTLYPTKGEAIRAANARRRAQVVRSVLTLTHPKGGMPFWAVSKPEWNERRRTYGRATT